MVNLVKFSRFAFFLILPTFAFSQQKTISQTPLGSSGLTFSAIMDQGTGKITMTLTGPSDRWFGAGFGSGMSNADVLLYTNGKTGALHTEGPTDYVLSATNAAGVTKDAIDNYTIIDNSVVGTVRTITSERQLNTSDAQDQQVLFSASSLNVVYARAGSVGMQLAYHGGSGARGVSNFIWATPDVAAPQLASSAFSPADNASGVALNVPLTISFNEDVALGAGVINLVNTATSAIVQSFDAGSISISGSTLNLTLGSNLIENTDYHVVITAGAVSDLAGNGFTGFNDATTWNFKTISNVSSLSEIISPINFEITSSQLTISHVSGHLIAVKIIDLSGKVIFQSTNLGEKITIDTNLLTKQTVFVMVEADGVVYSRKLNL